MKKITSIVITFLLFCSAYADTINSASKNTSVAVYGTQRTSTAIQPWVIPVAVAGAACNSTTDIVAVTSDHSSQLICQSGSWTNVSAKTHRILFTSSTTWVVPFGVSNVLVSLAGGGSSGGTAPSASFGGSSGGFLQEIPITVNPGESIVITIGQGGAGGGAQLSGKPGGTSSFGSYLQCFGGAAGSFSTVYPGAAGLCSNVPGYGQGFGSIGAAVLTNSFSVGGVSPMPNGYGSGGMTASWGNGAQQYAWPGSQGVVIVEY